MTLDWRKSSYSGATVDDNCVEVAFSQTVHVRDSKNTDPAALDFPATAWRSFLTAL